MFYRQVKSLVNRPKRRPLLRSLSNSESARGAFNQDHRMRCDSAIKTPDSPRRTFCPYSPAEVARQLTFKYSNYLLEMRPFEIVQYAQNYLDEDSSLQKIIELNKVLEAKIPSTILADLLLKSQKIGSIIEFWLKVAEELLELRNYECLQIVVHSLNSPMYDSSRLPEVWSHVDKLHLYNFEKLKVRSCFKLFKNTIQTSKKGTRRAQIPRKPWDPPISWIVTQSLIYITSYFLSNSKYVIYFCQDFVSCRR